VEDLRQILTVLCDVTFVYRNLPDEEELIETWTPSNSDESIYCEELTVGLVKKAARIKKILRL
jgi:hypothetical protein